MAVDPLDLARRLIRCASVTPEEGGALDLLQGELEALGFTCTRLPFGEVDNLYARLGTAAPNLCFAGHTDVVPPGEAGAWRVDPFEAAIEDGMLIGRGAADMKAAIACFVSAASRHLEQDGRPAGSLSLLITGDEEGPATDGTVKVLEWMRANGETIDACIVGEPTNPGALGEMIKIGRRGSLNGHLVVNGVQGHAAYPHLADNPVHRLVAMLGALLDPPLDEGSTHFQPSSLQVTSVDVGNPATNVIPARAKARFNVRFNDHHSAASLETLLRRRLAPHGDFELSVAVSGESFLTAPGRLSDTLAAAVEQVTGRIPELSTSGGTSDARFIKNHCPVAEFGLSNATAHKIDEAVPVAEIEALAEIYHAVLRRFFAAP